MLPSVLMLCVIEIWPTGLGIIKVGKYGSTN